MVTKNKMFDVTGCMTKAEAIKKAIKVYQDKSSLLATDVNVRKFATIALGNMKGYEEYHTDSAFDATIVDLTGCIYALETLMENPEDDPLIKAIKDAEQWVWEEYNR